MFVAACLLDFFVGQTQALADGRTGAELELEETAAIVDDGKWLDVTMISIDELELIAGATIDDDDVGRTEDKAEVTAACGDELLVDAI